MVVVSRGLTVDDSDERRVSNMAAIPYDGVLDRTIFPSAIIPLLKYGTVDNYTVDYNYNEGGDS